VARLSSRARVAADAQQAVGLEGRDQGLPEHTGELEVLPVWEIDAADVVTPAELVLDWNPPVEGLEEARVVALVVPVPLQQRAQRRHRQDEVVVRERRAPVAEGAVRVDHRDQQVERLRIGGDVRTVRADARDVDQIPQVPAATGVGRLREPLVDPGHPRRLGIVQRREQWP